MRVHLNIIRPFCKIRIFIIRISIILSSIIILPSYVVYIACSSQMQVSKPFVAMPDHSGLTGNADVRRVALPMTAADGDGGTGSKNFPVRALLTAAWCVLLVVVLSQPRTAMCTQLYTNTFAVRLHGPSRDGTGHVDEVVAHQVAKRAGRGFENVGKVTRTL